MNEENTNIDITETADTKEHTDTQVKKRWFGRGIYGSKDVPIRILDGLIGVLIVAIVVLITIFTINGGYMITFDTAGGSEVASVKLRHGEVIAEPEQPTKAGYEFAGWYYGPDQEFLWAFDSGTVGGDLTLTAHWIPAQVPVKFDLNGGQLVSGETENVDVTFGEPYGELPAVQKTGAVFDGWEYSSQQITSETTVSVNGEHVLTARWKE